MPGLLGGFQKATGIGADPAPYGQQKIGIMPGPPESSVPLDYLRKVLTSSAADLVKQGPTSEIVKSVVEREPALDHYLGAAERGPAEIQDWVKNTSQPFMDRLIQGLADAYHRTLLK